MIFGRTGLRIIFARGSATSAFAAVAVCMLVMRRRNPGVKRVFHTPWAWPVGLVAIFGCIYLFYSLPQRTQLWFLGAHVVGFAIYFLYGARRSTAGQAA